MIEPMSITVENVDLKIIYVRFRGSYPEFRKNSRKMFKELFDFAAENDLIIPGETKVLTMYDDNPFITAEKNLRTSVAMTVPNNAVVEESNNICVTSVNGKFGVGHFELSMKDYGDAWKYMYDEWLLKNPKQARDAVPFELYVTDPPKNFKNTSQTDIYIPVN